MNTSQDWDVIWKWQWFRRPLWQPHFRDPGHPEGKPARANAIWAAALRQFGAHRVLDCNCGLGLRSILLQEDGFSVVGTDQSPEAIQHARDLAQADDLPIEFFNCPWQVLGDRFTAEFDAIINDAFSWTVSRMDLRFAAHNFASALKPGGVLMFTGVDQWMAPVEPDVMVDQIWNSAPRFQFRGEFEQDGIDSTLLVVRDKQEIGVVENYLFLTRENGESHLETAEVCNSVHWTWEDYQHICHEAGFVRVESVRIPVGQRMHTLNIAHR
jgi:SAM-dependent methyltransferase